MKAVTNEIQIEAMRQTYNHIVSAEYEMEKVANERLSDERFSELTQLLRQARALADEIGTDIFREIPEDER